MLISLGVYKYVCLNMSNLKFNDEFYLNTFSSFIINTKLWIPISPANDEKFRNNPFEVQKMQIKQDQEL